MENELQLSLNGKLGKHDPDLKTLTGGAIYPGRGVFKKFVPVETCAINPP
jgi:hypothetical protein